MKLGLVHLVLGAGLVALWLRARPTTDPTRIRARTASQLSEHEWCRLGMEHGRAVHLRDRDWRRQRREWLKGLSRHLNRCEVKWASQGWKPLPKVLTFHRRYTEAQEAQR